MKYTPPSLRPAKEAAISLLERCGISWPPIHMPKVLECLGLSVIEKEFPSEMREISGLLDMEKKIIYVNSRDSFQRKMFTIAHEVGHFLLHEEHLRKEPGKYELVYRSAPVDGAYDPVETQANCFAAHLLVPKFMLDEYYDYATVDQLAVIFGVSKQVIGFRLATEY